MAKVFTDNEYFDFDENTSDEIKHNKLFAYIKKEVDNLDLSDKQRVADLQFFITRTIKHTPMLIEIKQLFFCKFFYPFCSTQRNTLNFCVTQ